MSLTDRIVYFCLGVVFSAALVGGVEQARIQWRDAEIYDLRADVASLEDRILRLIEDCAAVSAAAESELEAAHDECAEVVDAVAVYVDGQCNGRYVDLINAYNGLVDRYNELGAARRIYHIGLPGDKYDGLGVSVEDL